MAKWFGKTCRHQNNQWEETEFTGGPNFRENLPVLTFCNHADNTVDTEGNCSPDLCPIGKETAMEERTASAQELHANIKKLGENATVYVYDAPDHTLLEAFPNPFSMANHNPMDVTGTINITCPEFTSLCPKTGQPDFATIVIDYQPNTLCVESKALKLYLGSFRNHGEFHESCVCRIINDLIVLLDPQWIRVEGQFTPRGGIPFWPTAEYTRAAEAEPASQVPKEEALAKVFAELFRTVIHAVK